MILSFRTHNPGQTEQSDQSLHCLPFRLHRLDSLLYGRTTYSAGEEKSPLFIFLHDQLPFFLGETGRNSGKFLQVSPGNPIFSPGNICISP